jgi:dihydroxyacid dehydratase/phosphogluconate dehydratase
LPLTPEFLRDRPSGDVFGLTQNAGMGWDPAKTGRDPFLILSTQGGVRADDGHPIALGYHTGHWEVGLLVREAARELDRLGGLPFAAHVSDPCDGRTQGTTGMFDSLPYRNDAALVLRRLVRSLPTRRGVIAVGTCDKGLPAMTMALASFGELAGAVIPGGVTLPRAAERTPAPSRRSAPASPTGSCRSRRRPTSAAARAPAPVAAVSSSAPPRLLRWSRRPSS